MQKKFFLVWLAGFTMVLAGCDQTTTNLTSSNSVSNEETTSLTSGETETTTEETTSEITSEVSSEETSSEEETSSTEQEVTVVNEESSDAQEITVTKLLAKGNVTDTTNLYRTTGEVVSIDNFEYGDIYLSDGESTIQVYGLCKSSSCITKGTELEFSNTKDFSEMDISVGDTVTMECMYQYYVGYEGDEGTPELLGYVTSYISNGDPDSGNNGTGGDDYTGDEVYEGNYYNDVDSLTGEALLDGLHDLQIATQKTWVNYSSGLATHLPHSDEGSDGNIELFYNGQSGSWNREHVWPKSLTNGTFVKNGGGCDIHHIRPTNSNNNSTRGNKKYGEVSYSTGTISRSDGGVNLYNSSTFEPADSIKGDAARIIMYVYVHYSNALGSNPGNETYTGNLQITDVIAASSESGAWDLLRTWSSSDPVSSIERQRNNYAYSIQGNRNPFIDHPSYADEIWG